MRGEHERLDPVARHRLLEVCREGKEIEEAEVVYGDPIWRFLLSAFRLGRQEDAFGSYERASDA